MTQISLVGRENQLRVISVMEFQLSVWNPGKEVIL
jgi:hypothetical protein